MEHQYVKDEEDGWTFLHAAHCPCGQGRAVYGDTRVTQ